MFFLRALPSRPLCAASHPWTTKARSSPRSCTSSSLFFSRCVAVPPPHPSLRVHPPSSSSGSCYPQTRTTKHAFQQHTTQITRATHPSFRLNPLTSSLSFPLSLPSPPPSRSSPGHQPTPRLPRVPGDRLRLRLVHQQVPRHVLRLERWPMHLHGGTSRAPAAVARCILRIAAARPSPRLAKCVRQAFFSRLSRGGLWRLSRDWSSGSTSG